MGSYKIWNSKVPHTRVSKVMVKAHSEIDMFVGMVVEIVHTTTIKQTRKRIGVDSFRLYIDDKVVKAMYYNYKTKSLQEEF